MNNDFLDEKNFKFLINFVFNNIKQKGYDVNNDIDSNILLRDVFR